MHASTPAQAFVRSDIVRAGVAGDNPTNESERTKACASAERATPPKAKQLLAPRPQWRTSCRAFCWRPLSPHTLRPRSPHARALYIHVDRLTRVIPAGHGWWATRARPRGSTVAHPLRCPAFPLYYPPYSSPWPWMSACRWQRTPRESAPRL